MRDTEYQVKAGDTLSALAQRFRTTVRALARINGVPNPGFIRVGQVLTIPRSTAHAAFLIQGGAAPSLEEIDRLMAGFDDWGLFTLEQPPTELMAQAAERASHFAHEFSDCEQTTSLERPLHLPVVKGTGLGTMMAPAWLWERHAWRYYYRALAVHQPSVARILAGEDVLIRPTNSGAPYSPTQTQAEMTMRHLDSRGTQGLEKGTNRISTSRDVRLTYEISLRDNNTGEIIRVDPRATAKNSGGFIHPAQLLEDLAEWERETLRELEEARKRNSRSKIQQYESRLKELQKARSRVKAWSEGHAMEKIPAKAVRPVKMASPASQRWAQRGVQGMRVAGGVLLVYGAYSSARRIQEAPLQQRNRVITQETGSWAGGLAGAWAIGSLFAMGGAALGVPVGGVGALVVGGAGALVGGVLGGIGGALGADWVYTLVEENDARSDSQRLLGRPVSSLPYKSRASSALLLPPTCP